MMDDEDPVDLGPLSPRFEPEAFERRIQAIRAAAVPELLRRQAGRSVLDLLLSWNRPILAAATLLLVASVWSLSRPQASAAAGSTTLVEALGVPATVAAWVQSGRSPEPADLVGLGGQAP